MSTLSVFTWIGNAAAALCGKHGDVSAQARQAGCSRQSVYDHAAKVEQAVAEAQLPGPSRQQLLDEVAVLRKENQELWEAYLQSVDFPEGKQQHFTATASAMGLSLNQTLVLLAILLPTQKLPSRATLGRWVQQSARRAGKLLGVLDKLCRPLVLCLCLDEIFFRRQPVLMAVQPHSMVWVLGQRAEDRSGETWAKALAAWPELVDVAADGGTGIERGVELAIAAREQEAQASEDAADAKPIHARLDVFHTRRDGQRVLRQRWRRAEALWDEAVRIERAKERFDKTGKDKRQFNQAKVDEAWREAIEMFEQVSREEDAWKRVCAALTVIRPDGQLNDRQWAEVELQQASAELQAPAWAKVRRQLADPRTLTFLDRLHEELQAVEPDAERREALVALWRWRRQSRLKDGQGSGDGVEKVGAMLLDVVRSRVGPTWQESYRAISAVLWGVVRASSAVECVNSVVRMHQSRHRNLSQELLDLKRLYWNCRDFIEGKRKDRCPYELLGLKLPSYDPWVLLQMAPAELEKQLSSSELAA
jgi:hypothetical protein